MLRVVAGVVTDGSGRVLAALRGPGMRHAGAWEFPGGKVEVGEADAQALARELDEELGIRVRVGAHIGTSEVDGRVRLVVYHCAIDVGVPDPREHAELRWVTADQLGGLAWAQADVPLLEPVIRILKAEVDGSRHEGKPRRLT